jgi:hypothetical protein
VRIDGSMERVGHSCSSIIALLESSGCVDVGRKVLEPSLTSVPTTAGGNTQPRPSLKRLQSLSPSHDRSLYEESNKPFSNWKEIDVSLLCHKCYGLYSRIWRYRGQSMAIFSDKDRLSNQHHQLVKNMLPLLVRYIGSAIKSRARSAWVICSSRNSAKMTSA